ncbi:hypothetical protein HJC23_009547 [Cyclotella cryptica]|uniref:PDZ domain-containing protein n=1 Tax=Cyclotella cryptica TaxID=29204 RepID=A0ABD3Q696_9STRA|eukprot:CCRYP_008874-RA/>CCRYP_008874-RA protein AED:0.12 eAED:0.12 QI:0/-1/0/1/-1/1/1/0/820
MAKKNVTFIPDIPKYGTGDTSLSREAAGPLPPEYMNIYGPDYPTQNMSLRDDYYCADSSSCDPPGELNTYESDYDSYPYEIESIPVQRCYTNACRQPESYAGVHSQPASGVRCGNADFRSSRTQYIHQNSAKLSNGTTRVPSFRGSAHANPRSGSQQVNGTPFLEPSYRNTHGRENHKLPSSPHPCTQQRGHNYNSDQIYDHIHYQRELLNELIRLKREIHDKDADESCSGKFGYFIKTAFCQVENLAARRRKHLREAIGDVARSKTVLEFELRQQLIDITKQRLEVEERFQREINKQMSEKVAREAQLESMLLNQMEECVKLEMQMSGLDPIEESRLRMMSPTAKDTSISRGLPTAEIAAAVPTARVACAKMEKNFQPRARQQVCTKDEEPVVNKDSKLVIQIDDDESNSRGQEFDRHKGPMGPTVSKPEVLKDNVVSEAGDSATQKLAAFKQSKTSTKGMEYKSSGGSKQYRILSFVLYLPGTLGIEVEQRQDASLSAVVARVVPNSQADEAGVKKGDLLCHDDSDREFSYHEFLRLAKSGVRPLSFNVRRVESLSSERNDARSSIDATKNTQAVACLPEADARGKILVQPMPEATADADRLKPEDIKHQSRSKDYSGGLITNEGHRGVERVKNTNEVKSRVINSSNKEARKPVIPNVTMPEARLDTGLKPSLLVFTNDVQLAKVKPKKQDANKENAGCKPCLRVQTSRLVPSPKVPFSVANLNSPDTISKQKSDSIFKIFSPTHCYSPNASSAKTVTFSSEKPNEAEKIKPVSSTVSRIKVGTAPTVSVSEKKNRMHKSHDLKVTPVMATRGVIDVE